MYKINLKSIKPFIIYLMIGFLAAAGCVKDKAFENHEYGITDPANQPKGVLFQQSRRTADGVIVPAISSLEASSEPQTLTTLVKIVANDAVTSDLNVKVTLNNNLVDEAGLTVLDPANYQTSLDLVIPKGEKYVNLEITIPNSSAIDPSAVYGIGFTITEVGTGYTIAENSKDMVVGIAVKNQWDGTYNAEGYVYHPSVPRAFTEVKVLSTISANSVSCNWGDLGSSGYVALLTIDPATNVVTISDYSTGIPIFGLDALPTTNPGYTPKWSGSSLCNNTYDPATQTFYLRMAYVGGTGYRVDEEILTRQ